MRVAMVSPYSLSRPGGVQGQVVGLGRALRELGHEVSVVAPDDRAEVGEVAPDGTFVVGRVDRGPRERLGGAGGVVARRPRCRRGRFVAEGRLRRRAPARAAGPGRPLRLPPRRPRSPIVGTFHRSGGSAWYRRCARLARWAAGRLDGALRRLRGRPGHRAGRPRRGVPGRSSTASTSPASPTRSPYPTEGPTVLYVGRHEERKGLGVLLEAFEAVDDRGRRSGWRRRGRRPSGCAPPTRRRSGSQWLGELPEDELAARMAAPTCCRAPSLFGESFGVVVLEGLAAGCVVVASDLDGYRAAAGGHARSWCGPGTRRRWRRGSRSPSKRRRRASAGRPPRRASPCAGTWTTGPSSAWPSPTPTSIRRPVPPGTPGGAGNLVPMPTPRLLPAPALVTR